MPFSRPSRVQQFLCRPTVGITVLIVVTCALVFGAILHKLVPSDPVASYPVSPELTTQERP